MSDESRVTDKQTSPAEDVARQFHEAYERLAPSFGYSTRKASAVPWDEVPEPNRSLMIAVAGEVLTWLTCTEEPEDEEPADPADWDAFRDGMR